MRAIVSYSCFVHISFRFRFSFFFYFQIQSNHNIELPSKTLTRLLLDFVFIFKFAYEWKSFAHKIHSFFRLLFSIVFVLSKFKRNENMIRLETDARLPLTIGELVSFNKMFVWEAMSIKDIKYMLSFRLLDSVVRP